MYRSNFNAKVNTSMSNQKRCGARNNMSESVFIFKMKIWIKFNYFQQTEFWSHYYRWWKPRWNTGGSQAVANNLWQRQNCKWFIVEWLSGIITESNSSACSSLSMELLLSSLIRTKIESCVHCYIIDNCRYWDSITRWYYHWI